MYSVISCFDQVYKSTKIYKKIQKESDKVKYAGYFIIINTPKAFKNKQQREICESGGLQQRCIVCLKNKNFNNKKKKFKSFISKICTFTLVDVINR